MDWSAVVRSLNNDADETLKEMSPTLSFERTVAKAIEVDILRSLAKAYEAGAHRTASNPLIGGV